MIDPDKPETNLRDLIGRKFEIPRDAAPSTPAARALEQRENAKRHKVYNVDFRQHPQRWVRRGQGESKPEQTPNEK